MAVKPILRIGNDLLTKRSELIDEYTAAEEDLFQDLRDTLEDVMRRKGLGRGISGPQIGVLKQAVYIIEDGQHMTLINPRITYSSPEKIRIWDSCFCYDLEIFVLVERPRDIEVEYTLPSGETKKERFSGPLSELLQHEIDHLNGVFSIERMIEPKSMMWRNEWEAHGSPYIV